MICIKNISCATILILVIIGNIRAAELPTTSLPDTNIVQAIFDGRYQEALDMYLNTSTAPTIDFSAQSHRKQTIIETLFGEIKHPRNPDEVRAAYHLLAALNVYQLEYKKHEKLPQLPSRWQQFWGRQKVDTQLLLEALMTHDNDRVDELLRAGADSNDADHRGVTPFMIAAYHAAYFPTFPLFRLDSVWQTFFQSFLNTASSNPNDQDASGRTPLIYALIEDVGALAVPHQASAVALALLGHGADPLIMDSTGKNAIMYAINNHHDTVVILELIRKGIAGIVDQTHHLGLTTYEFIHQYEKSISHSAEKPYDLLTNYIDAHLYAHKTDKKAWSRFLWLQLHAIRAYLKRRFMHSA